MIVFLGVFVIFSGLLGPRIISHGLVHRDGFGVYGGLGKAVLFALLAFGVLVWHANAPAVALPKWRVAGNLPWIVLACVSFGAAWIGVSHLVAGNHDIFWLLGTHVFIWASLIFAAGGCFGAASLRLLLRTYAREIGFALLAAAFFYGLLTIIYGLWTTLAATVLHAVAWLLRLVGLTVAIVPPRTLLLDKFGITVAQYCSGIESLALFTGLYMLVGLLDWHRLDLRKFFWTFPLALLGLFGFNILRVFVLILGGYYINPHIAFSLFHTYAGMVFFILYSLLFWAIAYGWMLKKPAHTANHLKEKFQK